jgi:hypothetical protein
MVTPPDIFPSENSDCVFFSGGRISIRPALSVIVRPLRSGSVTIPLRTTLLLSANVSLEAPLIENATLPSGVYRLFSNGPVSSTVSGFFRGVVVTGFVGSGRRRATNTNAAKAITNVAIANRRTFCHRIFAIRPVPEMAETRRRSYTKTPRSQRNPGFSVCFVPPCTRCSVSPPSLWALQLWYSVERPDIADVELEVGLALVLVAVE